MASVFSVKTFDSAKNYAIEASAGTGKTFTIVEIVKKLVEAGTDINTILMVTYTEKAVGELKNRIREALKVDTDNAPIFTIHSFCQNTISEFCLEVDVPRNLALASDEDLEHFAECYIREGNIVKDLNDYKVDKPQAVQKHLIDGVKKYYLDRDNNEVPEIVSLQNYSLDQKDNVEQFIATQYLKDFYLAWQKEKERLQCQGYEDMLRSVREGVLHNPALKAKLQAKYTRAIIDEFQDTNQIQYDIFKAVFMEDDQHHIIVVGDRKQSIYSFQGADVTVFDKAVKEIVSSSGRDEYYLEKNWRSTADMVESCNKFFAKVDYFDGRFSPSTYRLPADKKFSVTLDGQKTPAFWIAELPGNNSGGSEAYTFAKIAVEQILHCCERDSNGKTRLRITEVIKEGDDSIEVERDVTYRDFTILAKTRSEMSPIVGALTRAGIPYIRFKDTSLFNGKECAHWIALLEAIDATDFIGKNRSMYKKALYSAFFGYSAREISAKIGDSDDTWEMKKMLFWKDLAKKYQWESLIEDILLESRLSKNMASSDEMQSYAIYRQLGEYCMDYLCSGQSLSSLTAKLTRLKNGACAKGDDDESGMIVNKASDFDCVKIMTIHASKGLEFPVVICAGGFTSPRSSSDSYMYHDGSRGSKLTFKKDIGKTYITQETEDEWKRLFYVAFTRAKYVLILPQRTLPKKKTFCASIIPLAIQAYKNAGGAYRSLTESGKPWNALRGHSESILASVASGLRGAAGDSKAAQDEALKDLIANRGNHTTTKYSYSSLTHGAHSEVPEEVDDEEERDKEGDSEDVLANFDAQAIPIDGMYCTGVSPIVFSAGYPGGKEVGSAMHEVFEKIDFEKAGLPHAQKELHDLIAMSFSSWGITMQEDWINDTAAMVENVLHADLPVIHGSKAIVQDDGKTPETFKLKELPLRDLKREIEYNFNMVDKKFFRQYCNGFIDVLFRQGEYYAVLDWKSDRTNDDDFASYSDAAELKKHTDKHYAIQRVLYSYCLVKWLQTMYSRKAGKEVLAEEVFNQHFGGMYYVYLRGCNAETGNGVYCQTWQSWSDLESAYIAICNKKDID